MTIRPTFEALEKLLLSLDFREDSRPGHVVFEHISGRPLIVLPRYRKRDAGEPIHLLSVKKTLLDVGLLGPDDFVMKLHLRNGV
jgi:hypothetical protein